MNQKKKRFSHDIDVEEFIKTIEEEDAQKRKYLLEEVTKIIDSGKYTKEELKELATIIINKLSEE